MTLPDFTEPQWEFLAVLEALGGTGPVDVISALAPLPPAQFLDLVRRGERQGILARRDDDVLAMAEPRNPEASRLIASLISPLRLQKITKKIEEQGLTSRIEEGAWLGLLTQAERTYEAAVLEFEAGRQAVCRGDFEIGRDHLEKALKLLEQVSGDPRAASQLVSTAVLISHLRFLSGRNITQLPELLEKAREAAERLGDRRSRALIGLHFATFYFLSDRLDEAFSILAMELNEIRKLGDEDIMRQSAEHFGLYYYLQGMYREAADHFEIAVEASLSGGEINLFWPVLVFLGYSSACLGRFHRAIGLLEASRRRATQNADQSLAGYFRSILGVVLLLMNKESEAAYHLHGARSEALTHNNIMVRVVCDMALAYQKAQKGQIEQAREKVAEIFRNFKEHGLRIRQYPTPLLLEILYMIHRSGLPAPPGLDFFDEMNRLLAGPNVHLEGVASRIRALHNEAQGFNPEQILNDLKDSENCLIRSGDPIELGRTRVELARCYLKLGKQEKADQTALMAWEGLSSHRPDYFPEELKSLLEPKHLSESEGPVSDRILQRLFDMLNRLAPTPNLQDLLGRLVESLNQFFQAERGGLFWFSADKRKKPELRAARNLTKEEVFSPDFRPGLTQVFKSFREKRPLIIMAGPESHRPAGDQILSILCLPIVFKGEYRGVLYLDNSYLKPNRTVLGEAALKEMASRIGIYVERILEHGQLLEERNRLLSAQRLSLEESESDRILTRSPLMAALLADANRAAATDSTVLITGETGSGKELLAKRIHMAGPRSAGPFIVVDLASTPEHLVESELFGHEKGAFTGADSQRIGRLELAHQGTLFIDELGEIPFSIQVKLLRVLQEKSFSRVGGSRVISSDFRLVAATNRNLEKEVSAGRFRQDLFYRLNVIPLHLPPLRQRGADAVLLADHFVKIYCQRFNRPPIVLSTEDENKLAGYSWPGNIRELKNVIERAVLLSEGDALALDLKESGTSPGGGLVDDLPTLDELQRRYIKMILEKTGGRVGGPGGAAEVLGMKRTSLYARMKQLGLR